MCEFFSFVMDETGEKYYFNWEQRQKNFDGADSHDHICHEYGLMKSKVSGYEYNPLTGKFSVDWTGEVDNRIQAEEWVKRLDFKTIVPALIIKPIVNPLTGHAKKPTVEQIELLKEWASVWDSVGASVWAYIGSFFDIEYKVNITPCVQLWEAGFVPSFDGTTWRLHSGESAKIVYEWKG